MFSSPLSCHSAPNSETSLPFVAKHVKTKTPEQIDAFATHAWRYFKLYLPSGTVEIAHTARYTWRTGKTELCVLATAPIRAGEYIEQLEGSMARLSPEEDAELSRSRDDGLGSRRDFSVVQVMGGNRSLLFLGPARFVNVRPIFSYSLSYITSFLGSLPLVSSSDRLSDDIFLRAA